MADVTFVGEDSRAYPQKYKDMGDGTFARVISATTAPGGGTDRTIIGNDYRALPRKLKDMGDGTFALIRIGG